MRKGMLCERVCHCYERVYYMRGCEMKQGGCVEKEGDVV